MPTVEIIVYAGIIQGTFLALALPKLTKGNRAANRLLAVLLLTASVFSLLFLNTIYLNRWSARLYGLLDAAPFVFAPLLYFYVRTYLFEQEREKTLIYHLIPAILHALAILSYFRWSNEVFVQKFLNGDLQTQLICSFSGLTVSFVSYWLLSLRLIRNFKSKVHDYSSYEPNLKYLYVLLGGFIITFVGCAFFTVHYFFDIAVFSFTNFNLGWIGFPVFTYIISYYAILQPHALRIIPKKDKIDVERIPKKELEDHEGKLKDLMRNERAFLNQELKLNDLAEKLGLDTTRTSWLIKQCSGTNFYDFVNKYRLEHFVDQLSHEGLQNKTLLGLAFEAGFNSKTTFNTTFKKHFDMTPSAYWRQKQPLEAVNA